ncbi:Cullin binding-domain-containing protein [Chytriomyces cf. hyalinus JEL632]|nr:Cullin binding-domain-containing protein [Chytriomyces cf. hyalinus JEL632]
MPPRKRKTAEATAPPQTNAPTPASTASSTPSSNHPNGMDRRSARSTAEKPAASASSIAKSTSSAAAPATKRSRTSKLSTSIAAAPAKSTSRSTKSAHAFSAHACESWFKSYSSDSIPNSNDETVEMDIEAIERFCNDIAVDVSGPIVLAIAYKLSAARMGVFSRAEWMNGMQLLEYDALLLFQCPPFPPMCSASHAPEHTQKISVDSTAKLQQKLPILESIFHDTAQVKDLYKWAFAFAKESPEKKYIEVEMAKGLWTLILSNKSMFRHVDQFMEYLNDPDEESTAPKVINKDQWMSFFDFSSSVGEDLSNYDESSAWPVMLDEFVGWCRSK